ncbi:MAG: histidine kinase [Flavobacteriales bacterium]|nr:histidine kinase [Flavobacteriales bacterium]
MRAAAVIVFTSIATSAVAQYPLVRTIEVRPGQQRPRIHAIAQDARGLIWAASDMGLLRTDGEAVEVMGRWEDGRIQALTADGASVVAVTAGGVLVRCGELGCDTLLRDSALVGARVSAMAVDGEGRLHIGTYGQGLFMFSNQLLTHWNTMSGLPDDHVNDVDLLPNGSVVVATDQGLALCDGERIGEVLGEAQGAPDNLVLCVAVDADGAVWAGTDRGGVFRWLPGSAAPPEPIVQPWKFGAIRQLALAGGMVWAATEEDGPVVIDRALEHGTYRENWRGRAEVLGLLRDADGAVWWCDGSEVLHRADPAILFVPEHEGLDLRGITALCADEQQRIWFATAQGIYEHVAWFSEERKVKRLPIRIDSRKPVVSLATSADGTLWAATFGGGVFAYHSDGTIRSYTTADGLSNDNVLSVRRGRSGMLFATLHGVSRFNGGRFERLAPRTGFIFDVAENRDGVVHLAADGRGVLRIEGEELVQTSATDGSYYALQSDADGDLWAIGPGTGFRRLHGCDTCAFGSDLPPFDGDMYALGSVAGRLVAFGSTGVRALDPRTGATDDVTAAFGMEDITAELNAIATDQAGALWFACSKGLVRLRPDEAHFNHAVRTSILTVQAGGHPVSVGPEVIVPHDRSTLVIRFTGTHWIDPAGVRFQYRLAGYSDRIIETRDREAAFVSLPPGRYRFQVRGFTGSPNDRIPWTELGLVIDPPWWRVPWVIVLAALIALVVVYVLIRARDRRMRYRDRMEREQVRFQLDALRSQVDPHFLFNSFNALVELIEEAPAKAVEHVEQLSTFFRDILQVRERERITLAEELRLLRNYFALEQRRFGDAIELRVEIGDAMHQRAIVPLTLQMLVENALKHNVISGGPPFVIAVSIAGDAVEVRNPLRPRATPPRSTGFGLDSITKRYRALTTRPIEVMRDGAEFIVRVPLIDPSP